MKRWQLWILIVTLLVGGGVTGWWVLGYGRAQPAKQATARPTPQPTPRYLTPDQVPAVTVSDVFQSSASALPSRLDPAKVTTIIATGDVIPARGVDAQIRAHGADYPFDGTGIRQLLSSGDLTVVDLESPLIQSCPLQNPEFTLCGRPPFAEAMAKASVDVATLENNHIDNFGQSGVEETMQHLTDAHINYATDSKLDIEQIHGLKIGFLAFNGVGGQFYPDQIAQQLKAARPQVDLLLVAFHWGKEYEMVPQPAPGIAPDNPRTIGHLAVDNGADLVIGNHPHWAQGVEIYKGKFISYAMGNFIFDQSWSTQTQQGAVGKYTFYGTRLIHVEYIPIHIYHQAQPAVATEPERSQILKQMEDSTNLIATSSAHPQ